MSTFSQDLWLQDTAYIAASLEHVVTQDYKKAEASFKHLMKKYPESEVGYYLYASVLATQMMDFEKRDREKEFYSTVKKANKIIKSKDKDERTIWDGYFAAGVKIIESGYKVQKGSYTAVFGGKSAMGLNNEFYEKDTNNADLAFYSGFYFYGMSKVWEKFSWMGADNSQDIQDAIRLLKKSEKSSIFSKNVSTQTLVNIYFENKLFEKAEREGEAFLKRYPNNRAIKWAMAKLYKAWDKPEKAILYYEELHAFFDTVKETYPYNYYNLCDEISKLYLVVDDKENSKKYINFAITNSEKLPEKYDKRLKKFIKSCKKRLKKME